MAPVFTILNRNRKVTLLIPSDPLQAVLSAFLTILTGTPADVDALWKGGNDGSGGNGHHDNSNITVIKTIINSFTADIWSGRIGV